jgi:uncharacterized membrane protein
MIYCKHCAKKYAGEGLDKNGQPLVCSECGEVVTPTLNDEEVRPLVQKLHKKSNTYRNRIDTGLSMIVIGAILLVIGLIFYYLSFKLDQTNKTERVFIINRDSSEYWVFILGVVIGGTLLVAGLALAITFALLRREIVYHVDEVREKKTAVVEKAPSYLATTFAFWKRHLHEASYQRQQHAADKKKAEEYLKRNH